MMNHSCEPNCAWSFDGKAMVIHAVTDISADEQVILLRDLHSELSLSSGVVFFKYKAFYQLHCIGGEL